MENLFTSLGQIIIENPILIIGLLFFIIALVLFFALLSGREVNVSFPVPGIKEPISLTIGSKGGAITANLEETRKLFSGGIVYVNVVGFSLLNHRMQDEIVTLIDRIVAELLAHNKQSYPPKENNFYIWYKSGWGDFFVYIEPHHNEAPSLVTTVTFFYALALLNRIQKEKPSIKIGVTVHVGEGVQYIRSGRVSNISGNSLNTAGRIMAFSDGGHFFISDSAFKNLGNKLFDNTLKGDCISLLDQLTDVSPYFARRPVDLFENNEIFNLAEWRYFDRNRKSHSFYNFSTSAGGEIKIGNPQHPPYWIPIEHRDDEHSVRSPNQRFVKHLTESDEVCIVGLTHENTSKFLRTALKERNGKFWKNIQIVFPSERLIHELKERDRSFETRKQKWMTGKRDIILFFEAQGEQHFGQWSCLECDDYLSFWGNRFKAEDKNVIRIAPLLQGSDLKHMPYLTFYEGMSVYNLLSEAFDIITINSNSIVEWDILGQYKDGLFFYQGLASHSHLSQIHDKCKPVVLVMLYMQEFEQTKSVLQKRTIFNASDKYDTYSNISGHLCIEDITNSETLGNFYKKITEKTRKNNISTHDDVLEESFLASQIFEKMIGWKPNTKVEDIVWERAALRELNEELKLSIQDESRLSFQQAYHLQDANLYFRIYSLLITREEFNQIREQQPHASLEIFGLADLRIKHRNNELNRLLQNKFDEIFVPLFHKLDISE